MTTPVWGPARVFSLESVLQLGAIGELTIGDASERIEATLGAPQLPPGPVDRKRRIWTWTYGNLGVQVSKHVVIGMTIDFEGRTPLAVNAGRMASWSLQAWQAFADREGWALREHASIIRVVSERAIVSLAPDGELHTVSLS